MSHSRKRSRTSLLLAASIALLVAVAVGVVIISLASQSGKGRFDSGATQGLFGYVGSDDNEQTVKKLLKNGANPNAAAGWPSSGTTPLHIAAKSGAFEIARVLVENGATNGAKNSWGQTALDVMKLKHPSNEELRRWENLLAPTNHE